MDDVIVIGAGLLGTAAAVFLAEGGARVTVLERDVVAAAASGRNAGSIQHPLDGVRAPLYAESLEHYRRFGVIEGPPPGLLAVGFDPSAARTALSAAAPFGELEPELLEGEALRAAEPALAPGLFGCRLATGYPVAPAAATGRFAAAARALGVRIEEGVAARPAIEGGRVTGVETPAGRRAAGAVLVAAGPWTPELVDPTGGWRPVSALWGVTVRVALERPPLHRIEEWDGDGGQDLAALAQFEVTPVGDVCVLGATRTVLEPDPAAVAEAVRERATRFLPAVGEAPTVAVRACPRPLSRDDVPLLGPLPGAGGLHVATGHGAYGISLGPASARIAADAILGRAEVPAAYAADRLGVPALT
ncbi:MAG: D-hydroxyproline dehydrogenase subunit beta [Solirubrobacteraceae bacterium]|nr:D-hydroxyproline dehydrogenase subunit beta [Solirubrobacteraceae bacterium]